jgi:hypothetical protein
MLVLDAKGQFTRTLPEEITVGSGALKADVGMVFCEGVNQNPVWFDVAIAAAGKISAQWVILAFWRQRVFVNKQAEHRLELHKVLTASFRKFNVFLKLAGSAESPHRPKSA